MSEPFPPYSTDVNMYLEIFRHPWVYAEAWLAGLGGRIFILTATFVVSAAYLWWHTKVSVGPAVAAILFGALVPLLLPEAQLLGYLSLFSGILYVLWKAARKVV
ncbi:MAG: hypothetical protein QXT28_09130 [Thermofilaceae archaeon]